MNPTPHQIWLLAVGGFCVSVLAALGASAVMLMG
jgi:hypothetical protein